MTELYKKEKLLLIITMPSNNLNKRNIIKKNKKINTVHLTTIKFTDISCHEKTEKIVKLCFLTKNEEKMFKMKAMRFQRRTLGKSRMKKITNKEITNVACIKQI